MLELWNCISPDIRQVAKVFKIGDGQTDFNHHNRIVMSRGLNPNLIFAGGAVMETASLKG